MLPILKCMDINIKDLKIDSCKRLPVSALLFNAEFLNPYMWNDFYLEMHICDFFFDKERPFVLVSSAEPHFVTFYCPLVAL